MMRLGLAVGLLLAVLAWTGYLGGWTVAGSAGAGDPERTIRKRAAALDRNLLSRKSRLALGEAVEQSLPRIGVARTVELAPRSTLGRAIVAAELDKSGAAEAALGVRAAIGSTRPEEIDLLPSRTLRQLGIEAAAVGHCREALPLLTAAVDRGQNDWSLRMKFAGCLNEADDPARALAVLAPMYEENPSSQWVWLFLAEAEVRLGKIDKAMRIARGIVLLAPDFYEAWRFAGRLYEIRGQPRYAARCYRRALHLRPANRWLLRDIGRLEKAARIEEAARAKPSRAPATPVGDPSQASGVL